MPLSIGIAGVVAVNGRPMLVMIVVVVRVGDGVNVKREALRLKSYQAQGRE